MAGLGVPNDLRLLVLMINKFKKTCIIMTTTMPMMMMMLMLLMMMTMMQDAVSWRSSTATDAWT